MHALLLTVVELCLLFYSTRMLPRSFLTEGTCTCRFYVGISPFSRAIFCPASYCFKAVAIVQIVDSGYIRSPTLAATWACLPLCIACMPE